MRMTGNISIISITAFSMLLATGSGCDKKRSSSGLAPASNWSAEQGAAPQPTAPGIATANPHGAAPGGDPHAGVDMTGAAPGGAPGAVDVTKMGLNSPDPARAINPDHVLEGTLEVDAKFAGNLKPGTAVFLVAKAAGPDGNPAGPPLAVQKLNLAGTSMPFTLTEADAMVAGTQLMGDVVLTARYDQDSDAISKQPGDLTGMLKVKVPGKSLKLVLNTVLP
jgi:hypothetical protein